MHDIDTLLDRMNELAVYSDKKVTMPIPIYESIRRILKEIQKSENAEFEALQDYLIKRGIKCTHTG